MKENKDYDHLFKVTIIGDSGVGKSCILLRFTDGNFEEGHPATIGVDFKTKIIEVGGKRINLTIWDTAGQEKFRSLTSSYYRGTHGIILGKFGEDLTYSVYDVTKRASFESVNHWLDEISTNCTITDVITLLVGNKVDMVRFPPGLTGSLIVKSHAKKVPNLLNKRVCCSLSAVPKRNWASNKHSKILETPTLWAGEKPATVTAGGSGEAADQPCFC